MAYPDEVLNRSFTDSFGDKNAVHIYRIDGGSICGLWVSILTFDDGRPTAFGAEESQRPGTDPSPSGRDSVKLVFRPTSVAQSLIP